MSLVPPLLLPSFLPSDQPSPVWFVAASSRLGLTQRSLELKARSFLRFTYAEADSWGVRMPNGRWTGLIRMLVEGEADLAAAELMMTSSRLDAVRFTTSIYSTK